MRNKIISFISVFLIFGIGLPNLESVFALTKSERTEQVKAVREQQKTELTAYRKQLKDDLAAKREANKTANDNLKNLYKLEIEQARIEGRTAPQITNIRNANTRELKSIREQQKRELKQVSDDYKELIQQLKDRQARDLQPIKTQVVSK
jgi:hypothetical protein